LGKKASLCTVFDVLAFFEFHGKMNKYENFLDGKKVTFFHQSIKPNQILAFYLQFYHWN